MANNGKKTSSKQIEEPTITDVQEVAVDSEEKKPVRKRKITKKSIEPIIEESKNEQEVSLGSTSTDELKVVNANKKQKKEVKSSVPAAAKPQSDKIADEENNVKDVKQYAESQMMLADDETIEISVLKRDTKKKSNKKKVAKNIPLNIVRFSPLLSQGLTSSQVEQRKKDGLTNITNKNYTKPYWKIICDNVFTFFNMLLTFIGIALLLVGSYTDLLFMAIMIANMSIGIFQEIRAKKTIDKLRLVTAPTATVIRDGAAVSINTDEIVSDDLVVLTNGNQISADAIVKDGTIEVNEAMLTGESLPVKKHVGDVVYAGSFVVSGQCTCQVDKIGEQSYAMTLQSQAKRYTKPKSELIKSLNNIILVISVIIVPIGAIMFYNNYRASDALNVLDKIKDAVAPTAGSIVGMIPAGMFLLTSVALAMGVVSLSKYNTSVKELYCIEMLARANVLCLDKTGTLTDGTMNVEEVVILKNSYDINKVMGAYLGNMSDNNQTSIALQQRFKFNTDYKLEAKIPFSSSRKYSAISFENEGTFILGAPEFILKEMEPVLESLISSKQARGYRVLMLAHSNATIKDEKLKGVISPVALFILADHIRKEAPDTIKWFRDNGVEIKIISGDNPLTASEIAKSCGVENADKYISLEGISIQEIEELADKYTVFGRVTPEQKAALVKSLKNRQKVVAMTGDGVNDILAMKNADCSIAMSGGSEATKNVAHLVLLDSNFASMPKVVEEGRRVVNNVQRSSSLFLMKTFFTIILSLSIIIVNLFFKSSISYPFSPKNLIVMEVCGIGIPSTLLAIQPNKSQIKGKFLKTVIMKALPGTILMLFAVLITGMLSYLDFFELGATSSVEQVFTNEVKSFAIIALIVASLVMLYHLCKPFNAYRLTLFISMLVCAVIGIFMVPYNFTGISYTDLNKIQWLSLIVLCASFGPISYCLNWISDRLLIGKGVPEVKEDANGKITK